MNKEEFLNAYRQWKLDPMKHIPQANEEKQHCGCCETEYTGNFCPRCGQKAGIKRITWASIWKGLFNLWGMGSRSLPNTLWQLIWRPGYLIGDYISGRRQVSFPPIRMLVLVGVFVLILDYFMPIDLSNLSNFSTANNLSEKQQIQSQIAETLYKVTAAHQEWAQLIVCTFLIVPTYFVFKFAPRCGHHTLPEGFFIQVFIAVELLLVSIIFSPFLFFADIGGKSLFSLGTAGNVYFGVFYFVSFFVLYRTYYQLFGYGHWATLWRLLAVLLVGFAFLMYVGLCIPGFFIAAKNSEPRLFVVIVVMALILLLLLLLVLPVLLISYFISKRTAKKRQSIQDVFIPPIPQ